MAALGYWCSAMSEAKSAVLAAAEREARALDHQETIAVVRLAGESYGMTASQVAEIVRPQEIVEVPNAPEHVEGVINLRGRIIPVVDLRRHLGMPDAGVTAETRIVITEIHSKAGATETVGLIVDGVQEVRTIGEGQIDDKVAGTASVSDEYLRGVVNLDAGLIILLDIDKAF